MKKSSSVGSKSVKKRSIKKQPFAKRKSSLAPVAIALLFAFNFVYSYAIGIPVVRVVVDSYVESVYALGDAQVRGYEAVGGALAAAVFIPVQQNLAALSTSVDTEVALTPAPAPEPEPLLKIAPNQISIAK